MDLFIERFPMDTKDLSSFCLMAACLIQDCHNMILFHLFKGFYRGRWNLFIPGKVIGQILGHDDGGIGKKQGFGNDGFEFPYISRP